MVPGVGSLAVLGAGEHVLLQVQVHRVQHRKVRIQCWSKQLGKKNSFTIIGQRKKSPFEFTKVWIWVIISHIYFLIRSVESGTDEFKTES